MSEQRPPRMIRFASAFALFMERERERAGLTQKKLGKLLDVTEAAVGHWENGVRAPTTENLEGLFRALGLSMSAGFRTLAQCAVDIEERGIIARAIRNRLEAIAKPVPGTKRAWIRRADVPDAVLSETGKGGGARGRGQKRRARSRDQERAQPAAEESRSPARGGSPR